MFHDSMWGTVTSIFSEVFDALDLFKESDIPSISEFDPLDLDNPLVSGVAGTGASSSLYNVFKGAIRSGASMMAKGGIGGLGSRTGVSRAPRMNVPEGSLMRPEPMADAKGPRAIKSADPRVVHEYWLQRMRQFARTEDIVRNAPISRG